MTLPMAAFLAHPLAQSNEDLLDWAWTAFFAVGLLLPVVGLLVSVRRETFAAWKGTLVAGFYAHYRSATG